MLSGSFFEWLFTDDQIKQLIKEKNPKTAASVQDVLKKMYGQNSQKMLEAELDNRLGYSKYDYRNKKTDNCRSGHSTKRITGRVLIL